MTGHSPVKDYGNNALGLMPSLSIMLDAASSIDILLTSKRGYSPDGTGSEFAGLRTGTEIMKNIGCLYGA